jgi:hypothetical protein
VRPDALALFVRFVRLNPQLPADAPELAGVLDAYERLSAGDEVAPALAAVLPAADDEVVA